jgi:hypothetical protein
VAELLQRLDRLPDGHPSSPYHDDGSRKPPVMRLRDLELPLPDEERMPAMSAKHDLAEHRPARPVADREGTSGGQPSDHAQTPRSGRPGG